MIQRNKEQLRAEYILIMRYATRFQCGGTDELLPIEKDMYSNHIKDSYQKMSMDDLLHIYTRVKNFNNKFKGLYDNLNICMNMDQEEQDKNDIIYREYEPGDRNIDFKDYSNACPRSKFYWLDKIKDLLNIYRFLLPYEAKNILDFCLSMENNLHFTIINKMGNLSEEELKEEEEYLNRNLTEVSLKAVREGITDWEKLPEYEIAGDELYYFQKVLEQYNDYGPKRM